MNQELKEKFNKARKRLRSTSYWLSENGEPLRIIQELYYNTMALRAEMTTIMDLLSAGKKFEEDEYMAQMVHRLDETTRLLCSGAQIMVDDFGLVVDLKKMRSDGKEHRS